MREDVLSNIREGGLGLKKNSPIADVQLEHLPVEHSQIEHLPIQHFEIEDLQIENLQRTHLQIEHVQFANLERDGDHSILGFVLSRPLTSVGMCLNSFFYVCFLAISVLFRFLLYLVLLWVFRHEMQFSNSSHTVVLQLRTF